MRDHFGLTEKTVVARVRYAAGLLDGLAAVDGDLDWTRLDASGVNAYVRVNPGWLWPGPGPARRYRPGPVLAPDTARSAPRGAATMPLSR